VITTRKELLATISGNLFRKVNAADNAQLRKIINEVESNYTYSWYNPMALIYFFTRKRFTALETATQKLSGATEQNGKIFSDLVKEGEWKTTSVNIDLMRKLLAHFQEGQDADLTDNELELLTYVWLYLANHNDVGTIPIKVQPKVAEEFSLQTVEQQAQITSIIAQVIVDYTGDQRRIEQRHAEDDKISGTVAGSTKKIRNLFDQQQVKVAKPELRQDKKEEPVRAYQAPQERRSVFLNRPDLKAQLEKITARPSATLQTKAAASPVAPPAAISANKYVLDAQSSVQESLPMSAKRALLAELFKGRQQAQVLSAVVQKSRQTASAEASVARPA